jgi:hypothetical protein
VPDKKNAPGLTRPQVHFLVCGVIPQRTFDARWVLEGLASWPQRHYIAYRAVPSAHDGSHESSNGSEVSL